MGPLHPSLALAGHQFAEHLRVDKVSPKSSSVQPSLGRDPVSVDETVQALKHLLTKERQATAALHEDLDETRTALQESSDALQESLEHRASLQRLLRGVLDHCAAKGLSVPQHLTGRGMKPMQGDKSSQRSKQQASRVTAYDGAGASEPFEQP
jgi:hypothetical protein